MFKKLVLIVGLSGIFLPVVYWRATSPVPLKLDLYNIGFFFHAYFSVFGLVDRDLPQEQKQKQWDDMIIYNINSMPNSVKPRAQELWNELQIKKVESKKRWEELRNSELQKETDRLYKKWHNQADRNTQDPLYLQWQENRKQLGKEHDAMRNSLLEKEISTIVHELYGIITDNGGYPLLAR